VIVYFPTAYPDELLYSRLSRYYARSGYMAYTFAAEELFAVKTVKPDMEFVNAYTPCTIGMITKYMPMNTVIQKHTMFPCYGHFLPYERKLKAFRALVSMNGEHHNLLPLPKSNSKRYLRYCQLCAIDDRRTYGETYWHRLHQIYGMNVCPIHGCYLRDSSIRITSKAPPMLKTAEECISFSESVKFTDNDVEYRLCRYMAEIFQIDVDINCTVSVGKFIHSKLAGGKYCSPRGENRNISLFHSDFYVYYKTLPDNKFTELWQIQKVLSDHRTNFHEVCMIAMFLNIDANDLVHRRLPEKTCQQVFDEKVFQLREQGLKYTDIAKCLEASYDVVKSIGEQRYITSTKRSESSVKGGIKRKEWEQIDKDTLPLVWGAVRQLQTDNAERPVKISIATVERMLNMYKGQISYYMPLCRDEIMRHIESQEQYWAREVVWAAKRVIDTRSDLTWTKILRLTNIRRVDFIRCLPYVKDYADSQVADLIERL